MGEVQPVVGASQNGTRGCAWMSLSLWGASQALPGSLQMKALSLQGKGGRDRNARACMCVSIPVSWATGGLMGKEACAQIL